MSVYYVGTIPYSSELYHYGVPGMKWGVRNDYEQTGRKLSVQNRIGIGAAKVKRIASAFKAVGGYDAARKISNHLKKRSND